MTREELKIRRLTNQYLIQKGEKHAVIRDLCGVQAQFMANAIHSLKIRCHDFDETTVADGLVKNWTVRGTVHVFSESDLALFKHCENGKSYHSDEWRGYSCWQRPDGRLTWDDDGTCTRKYILRPERQRYFSHLILEAVSARPQTRDELKQLCTQNGMTAAEASVMFESWGGGIRDVRKRIHELRCRGEKGILHLSSI